MAYFIAKKVKEKLLIYHKDAYIIEYTVEDDKVKQKIHSAKDKTGIYWDTFLSVYDSIPCIRISKNGNKFFVEEFESMKEVESVLTKTELKNRLRKRGMHSDQIKAVFIDLETL